MRPAAQALLDCKDELARAAAETLYRSVPGLLERFGEAGRRSCRDDLRHTIEHLIPAVGLGEPDLFERYVVWLCELLEARGVSRGDVVDSLVAIEDTLPILLDARDVAPVVEVLRAGRRRLEEER